MFAFPKYIEDLTPFILDRNNSIFELNDYPYEQVKEYREGIDDFILAYSDKMELLDYSLQENRAFLFLLFDLCERLQLTTSFEQLCLLVAEKGIEMSARQKAAVHYGVNIAYNQDYIDRFEEICKFLERAITEEQEDLKRVLATFINYYLTVLDIHPKWIIELRDCIHQAIDKYPFLAEDVVQKVLAVSTKDARDAHERVQALKDELLKRKLEIRFTPDEIETGEYAERLREIMPLSFQDIRSIAVENAGTNSARDISVKPLETDDEMFLYLRNYGNMHQAKMHSAIKYLPLSDIAGSVEIIDWGCGQALASFVLLEYLREAILPSQIRINRITLIEPSDVAIKRGALHINQLNSKIPIRLVRKFIDDVSAEDIAADDKSIKIHLFSNILDIEEFSIPKLADLIAATQQGMNYFICASPYINDVRSLRLFRFSASIEDLVSQFTLLGEEQASKRDPYWDCNNNQKKAACDDHPSNGCYRKWTKVINVFKVRQSRQPHPN